MITGACGYADLSARRFFLIDLLNALRTDARRSLVECTAVRAGRALKSTRRYAGTPNASDD